MDGYHQPVLVQAQTRPEGAFLEHSSAIPANIASYEVTKGQAATSPLISPS